MATGLTLSLIFLSFVVVTGMGGMVSLAQATFVLMAGLTTGMLINRYEWSFFPAIVVGVAATVVLSTIIALPALRLGGLPLALATLALAFLGDGCCSSGTGCANSQSGWPIPRPKIGPFDMSTLHNKTFAMFVLLLVGITALLIYNLKRSSWGRADRGDALVGDRGEHVGRVGVPREDRDLRALGGDRRRRWRALHVVPGQRQQLRPSPPHTGLLWLATRRAVRYPPPRGRDLGRYRRRRCRR